MGVRKWNKGIQGTRTPVNWWKKTRLLTSYHKLFYFAEDNEELSFKYMNIHLLVSSNSSQLLRLVICRSLGPRAIFRDQEWFELSCLHWYVLDFSVTKPINSFLTVLIWARFLALEPNWLLSNMESLYIGWGHGG